MKSGIRSASWSNGNNKVTKTFTYTEVSHLDPLWWQILLNIVLSRLSRFYASQLLTTQFSFWSSKGCNDSVYVIKQLQENAYLFNRKLYTCFADLTTTYNINRRFLFPSSRNHFSGFDSTACLDLIELYWLYMVGEDSNTWTF